MSLYPGNDGQITQRTCSLDAQVMILKAFEITHVQSVAIVAESKMTCHVCVHRVRIEVASQTTRSHGVTIAVVSEIAQVHCVITAPGPEISRVHGVTIARSLEIHVYTV